MTIVVVCGKVFLKITCESGGILKLQTLRISAGFPIQFVADRIGVNVKTVYDWEKGNEKPSKENLIKLEKLFGVSMEEMMG